MRKALLSTAAIALIVTAAAHAKTGVVFDGDQTTAKAGAKVHFTVIAMREPRDPTGDARAIVGRKPLVTFRSASGQVIRVRTTTTDLNGIAYGSVAFTDKGPWTTAIQVGHETIGRYELSEPFPIGRPVPHGAPLRHDQPPPAPTPAGFPWIWVVAIGLLASAAVLATAGRRGHRGATS